MNDDQKNAWRSETEYMDLKDFRELAVLPTPEKVIDCADRPSSHGRRRHIH